MLKLYKCLSDFQRLRILNLLEAGPLCVCHLMEVLAEEQVKLSKQLAYMKRLGLVAGERKAQWMVYRLVGDARGLLAANLQFLREREQAGLKLAADERRRDELLARMEAGGGCCPDPRILKPLKLKI